MDTPTIHRNVGNTVSVMVQPCQAECCSGAYETGPPGLFTTIIRAIVAPRSASNATRRSEGAGARAAATGVLESMVEAIPFATLPTTAPRSFCDGHIIYA